MYRKISNVGFLPVLQSFGPSPLQNWDAKIESGFMRRVTDELTRSLTIELSSVNVATCYLRCPIRPRASLGIYMNYVVLIVKNMNKYFTFEITILDDRNVRRRLRFGNFHKSLSTQYFSATLPLCLKPDWNELQFDLADMTRQIFKTKYVETTRIQIHANCRIRIVYFCDKIYQDHQVPQKFKIFFRTESTSKNKKNDEDKAEPIVKKMSESIVFRTDYGEGSHEEEEAEDGYVNEEQRQRIAASATLSGSMGREYDDDEEEMRRITAASMILTLDEGDENYYDDDDDDEVGLKSDEKSPPIVEIKKEENYDDETRDEAVADDEEEAGEIVKEELYKQEEEEEGGEEVKEEESIDDPEEN